MGPQSDVASYLWGSKEPKGRLYISSYTSGPKVRFVVFTSLLGGPGSWFLVFSDPRVYVCSFFSGSLWLCGLSGHFHL